MQQVLSTHMRKAKRAFYEVIEDCPFLETTED